jgi:hypothetical protein
MLLNLPVNARLKGRNGTLKDGCESSICHKRCFAKFNELTIRYSDA